MRRHGADNPKQGNYDDKGTYEGSWMGVMWGVRGKNDMWRSDGHPVFACKAYVGGVHAFFYG